MLLQILEMCICYFQIIYFLSRTRYYVELERQKDWNWEYGTGCRSCKYHEYHTTNSVVVDATHLKEFNTSTSLIVLII